MKQVLIIGLGQFGAALARALSGRGVQVLAVDREEELVQDVAADVDEAITFDATDERELASVSPAERDICVCAIGHEARESAILVTALLRQLGAKHIIARANDALLERILRLVGAHEVVNPERAFGERLARRLLYQGLNDELPLGKDLMLIYIEVRPHMIGRSLAELDFRNRYRVTVVAIHRTVSGKEQLILPTAAVPLQAGDLLLIVAKQGESETLFEE